MHTIWKETANHIRQLKEISSVNANENHHKTFVERYEYHY